MVTTINLNLPLFCCPRGRMTHSELRRQLVLGVAIGVGVTVGAYLLKSLFNNPNTRNKPTAYKPKLSIQEEDLLDKEQLVRLAQYFGEQRFERVRNSKVVVFGLGGVGSHVVNMLMRSGVKHIKLIDFDRVSLSSLGRHAYALREDVGTPKTECMRKYIHKIFPHAYVETVEEYATKQNISRLLEGSFDYVIDCIDNIAAKTELAAVCVNRNLRLVVSGGAGMKNDATQLQIRDIADVRNDQLLAALRKKLYRMGIRKGIKCVFSRQEAIKQLLPLNEQQEKDPFQYKVFDNYRVRIVPVLGTMPALMGQTIASYVLCGLCDEPYEPYDADDIKVPHYTKIYNRLLSDEKKLGIKPEDMQFDVEDVYLLMRHIHKWRCFDTGGDAKQYYLTKWDVKKPANLYNLVPMSKEGYERHYTFGSLAEAGYPPDMHQAFQGKCQEIRQLKGRRDFMIVR